MGVDINIWEVSDRNFPYIISFYKRVFHMGCMYYKMAKGDLHEATFSKMG